MRALVLAVVLVLVTGQMSFAHQPDKKAPPKPLPDDIVKAWKDAGADVGWSMLTTYGALRFVEKPEVGAIPAFRLGPWRAGMVAKLPVPEAPFGLDLYNTEVTDDGLKELSNLRNLTTLNLSRTNVTDAGLKELANLKNLTTLYLHETKVTNVGMKELAKLKNLTVLNLGDTKVTDAGVKELANLKSLTTLDLSHTEVTDAGLKELANLKNLTTLNLSFTKVTKDGVAALQKALPKCLIRGP
jgi:hypothetical protein